MPPAEVVGRIAEVAHSWGDRCRYGFRRAGSGNSVSKGAAADLAHRAASLLPGHLRSELKRLEKHHLDFYSAWAKEAGVRADRFLEGRWTLLGRSVDFTGTVNWHRDPGGDYEWPRRFYGAVDLLQTSERQDVKFVWELNRHQFLVELGRAWLLTGNEPAARRARELLLDWIQQNPLYEGVNWTSALEAAMRGINWMWTLAALSDWPGWEPGDLQTIAVALCEHAEILLGHLSFFSSPYNHLVGEATGLVVLGTWLEGIAERAPVWRRRGIEVLRAHTRRQFYPDGLCVEQAMGYHYYTLGFLTQAVMMAEQVGAPFPELVPVLHKAWQAGAALRQPGGDWPALGDVDSARSVPVYPDNYWDFRGLCSLGAVLYADSEVAAAAERPGQELYWMLGMPGIERFDRLPEKARPTRFVLPDSGYAVANSSTEKNADWVLFDCGPVGDGVHPDDTPSTAHGHADFLQVLLVQNGESLLVDPGMPSYFGPRVWERHFRSSAAHNTIEVEGLPMARPAGRLAWSNVCQPEAFATVLDDEVWWMRGAIRLASDVVVTRELLGVPGAGLWIADRIEGAQGRACRWYWQYPKSQVPVLRSGVEKCSVWSLGDKIQSFGVSGAAGGHAPEFEFLQGEEAGPAGWNSRGYGEKTPACRASIKVEAGSSLLSLTYIGRPGVAGQITASGTTVQCGDLQTQRVDPGAVQSGLVWHLSLEGRSFEFLSGAPTADERWKQLGGTEPAGLSLKRS